MGNFAVLRGTRDGVVTDLDHPHHSLGSEDTWAGRGQLRFVFGKDGDLLLSGDYGRSTGVPLTYAKPIAPKPGFSFDSPSSLWAVRTSHVTTGRNIQQGAAGKLTLRLNRTTTLTSLTAYRRSNYRFFIDADATELSLQTSDVPDLQHQVSEELTVVQRTPKLTWIGGLFFFDEHNEGQVEITVYPIATQIRPFATIGANAWALFGQATYSLVEPGVANRWDAVHPSGRKHLNNTGGEYRLGTTTLTDPATFYDFAERAGYDAWTPKGSIQVQTSDQTFVYISATRGFKSGGFNPAAREPGHGFSPEFVWSYEGGLKRTMAGGRLRTNAALFYSDYPDLQVESFIRPGMPEITNAGAATQGVEAEVDASVGRGLKLQHPSRGSTRPTIRYLTEWAGRRATRRATIR